MEANLRMVKGETLNWKEGVLQSKQILEMDLEANPRSPRMVKGETLYRYEYNI